MPHRKQRLVDIAGELFVSDPDLQSFLIEKRGEWARDLDDPPNEYLELLIARFDIGNYRFIDQGNEIVRIEFQWPDHLRARTAANAEAAHRSADALVFPRYCRRVLNGEESPSAEEFWQRFAIIRDWSETVERRDSHDRRTALAAGVAVLATVFPQWLAANSSLTPWCLDTLKALSADPPDREYSPAALMENSAEGMLAEAALAFMPDVKDGWLRELAARGVMGHYYASTGSVLRQAFRLRGNLGDYFVRTLNLMICWAAVRSAGQYETSSKVDGPVTRHSAEDLLLRAYATKRLPAKLLSIERIDRIARRAIAVTDARAAVTRGRFAPRERKRGRHVVRNHPALDTDVLSRGFSFLGDLAVARSTGERADLIGYRKTLLNYFLKTMPRLELESEDEEVEGTPDEFDRWVLAMTAAVIPQLSSPGERREFWRPIMDLGPGAHYWLEEFFIRWLDVGIRPAKSLDDFAAIWQEMMRYGLDAEGWRTSSYKSYSLERSSIELMGLGWAIDIVSAAEFVPIIDRLVPEFERWAGCWLDQQRPAQRFSYLLSRPAGRALLPLGIVWLNQGVQGFSEGHWEDGLAESVAGALRACWRSTRAEVSRDPALRRPFLDLLNTLCQRSSPDALALREEVGQSIPQGGP